MEIIDVKTSLEQFAKEIEKALEDRHWHLTYFDNDYNIIASATGFKNEEGTWDIF